VGDGDSEADRQTNSGGERETERKTERHTEWERDRERERQRERVKITFISDEDGEGRQVFVEGPRGHTIPILKIGEAIGVGDVIAEEHGLREVRVDVKEVTT
jgi:hypothetical protein